MRDLDKAINSLWANSTGESAYNAVIAYILLGMLDKARSLAEKAIPTNTNNLQVKFIFKEYCKSGWSRTAYYIK